MDDLVDMNFEDEPVAAEEKPKAKRSRATKATKAPRKPAAPASPPPSDDEMPSKESMSGERSWYVVHCYSGYENKVRHNLEQRIETMGMKDKIFDVVIPTQEEIEVKDGKRRTVERHVFPGYVLVNMVMTEESWYVVRNTPGVTGFVGMGNAPTALRPEEVSQILQAHGSRGSARESHLQGRRTRAHRRRSIQRLPRHGRGDRHGALQGARDGQLLRPRDASRTGLLAGGEGVTAKLCCGRNI